MAKFGQQAAVNNVANIVGNTQYEAALGFINLALPDDDGVFGKIGMLSLKLSEDTQKDLYDALASATPEVEAQILAWVKENIRLDFKRNVKASAGKAFGFKSALGIK